jgi:hypothetical protein
VGRLYYQLNHHSIESIVKTRRNPRLIREYELSYSGKAERDRASSNPLLPDGPGLRFGLARTTLNPAKVIGEIKKLIVLGRKWNAVAVARRAIVKQRRSA